MVILSIPPLLADPLDSWQVRSPSPAGQDYFYGDGQWIGLYGAGGDLGAGGIWRMRQANGRRSVTPFDVENKPDFVIATSFDGRHWTKGSASGGGRLGLVAYGDGRRMIKENNTRLWSSEDGEEWTEHLTGFADGALRSDGRRVLLFDSEALRASGRLTPARPPSLSLVREGPEIALWVGGEIGERYEIEQSLDLDAAGWALLQEITLATDPQRVGIDLPAGNRGFWRARGPAN